ncbi:MAG: hypothetical protein U0W24_10280 [Bacteroidales bacterium]
MNAPFIKWFLFVLIFFSCQQKNTNRNAFYYWKTKYTFGNNDQNLADSLNVKKFYLRFFDVDWSETRQIPIPVSEFHYNWQQKMPDHFVPCVFITNTVVLKCSLQQLDTLANKMKLKIDAISHDIFEQKKWEVWDQPDSVKNKIKNEWPEIQFDCDWTPDSKSRYFYLVKKMKQLFPDKVIAVTLRLWQLKNKEMSGIPPADKVMLMCYSIGNPKEYSIENSIASVSEIEKYIHNQDYSLPVDIALPVYSWGVIFRNKKFRTIATGLDIEELENDPQKFIKKGENTYQFLTDTVIGNQYIRFGDELRYENLEPADLENLIKILKKTPFYSKNSTIAFFSWDTTYINHYGKENLKKYYNLFN